MARKFNKEASRSVLHRYVADVTGMIYNGTVHAVPKRRVLKQIRTEASYVTSKIGLSGTSETLYRQYLIQEAAKTYQTVVKNSAVGLRNANKAENYKRKLEKRVETAFKCVKNDVIDSHRLSKVANHMLNKLEYDAKMANMSEMLAESYSPFYLASAHPDCASDHVAYQGKMYYDADWADKIPEESPDRAKIEAYIHNHNLMSLQEVTGSPHYFLTRPNCRHYVVNIPLQEVMKSSVNKLLISHKLITTKKNMSDAERYARAYKERYDQLHLLWDLMPSEQLGKELNSTRKLFKKWQNVSIRAKK